MQNNINAVIAQPFTAETDLERKGEIEVCIQQTTLWKNNLI